MYNYLQLAEVMDTLVSNAWDMTPESIEQLAIKFDVKDRYLHMMNIENEPSRGQVVESIFKEWSLRKEGASLFTLKIALRCKGQFKPFG